jgi:hypothetical protein
VFGRLACGNEGRVEFTGISYCLDAPRLGYHLRHRQATAGKVEYDTTHSVTVVYWCENDSVRAYWNFPGSNHPGWPLDTSLQAHIYPKQPAGPGNPPLPTERLDGLAEAMAPFAAALRIRPRSK